MKNKDLKMGTLCDWGGGLFMNILSQHQFYTKSI